jgi:hypothetical protein
LSRRSTSPNKPEELCLEQDVVQRHVTAMPRGVIVGWV